MTRHPDDLPDLAGVLHVFARHDDWFVPISWAAGALTRDTFARIIDCGEPASASPRRLWIFTSREALAAAERRFAACGGLGIYVGPVTGGELFGSLGPGLRELEINPGLPPDQGFYFEGPDLAASFQHALGIAPELSSASAPG